MLTTAEIAPKRAFPILRSTYHQLGEAGVFQGRRVQLVYGTIIDMSPMGIPHRTALRVLNRTFVELVPRTWDVMVQVPLDLADDSEPEPDFSFVPRFTPGEVEPHAAVVMELADSSLKLDLGPRQSCTNRREQAATRKYGACRGSGCVSRSRSPSSACASPTCCLSENDAMGEPSARSRRKRPACRCSSKSVQLYTLRDTTTTGLVSRVAPGLTCQVDCRRRRAEVPGTKLE